MSLYVPSRTFAIPAQSIPIFHFSLFFFYTLFFPFFSFLSPFVYPLLSLLYNSSSYFPFTLPPPSTQAQPPPSLHPSLVTQDLSSLDCRRHSSVDRRPVLATIHCHPQSHRGHRQPPLIQSSHHHHYLETIPPNTHRFILKATESTQPVSLSPPPLPSIKVPFPPCSSCLMLHFLLFVLWVIVLFIIYIVFGFVFVGNSTFEILCLVSEIHTGVM